ncbi:MAG: ABC transporter permease [Oscillospiraceae bacterium]|jgi:simple sugar transport system permease protein|nr:ABC transporter permease [Oscillospiraceae bacterium]
MSKKPRQNKNVKHLLMDNSVPLMFIVICAICIPLSGFSPSYLINEIVTRLGRNLFLVLCLLFPIMAGMGLNFAMTLGAMAGEIGLILASDWQIWGIPGIILAMILSIPISIFLGYICGTLMNMARGREMITSYIINYFINGIYLLVVLYMMGPIIPIMHSSIKLPRGYGIRNTTSLLNMRQRLDDLLAVNVGGVKIPVLTFLIIGALCLFIVWFRRTKLGQDMRAVGQDMEVAREAGIKVERTRIISIILSTVFAGFGMVIYLQNMGNMATYTSHSQIGMFCIAALLVGGAAVDRASIGNAFLGVILFHLMFIVAPSAGAKITGDSMIGEYFRVFVSYGVITVALVMYEMKKRSVKSRTGQLLAQAQREEAAGK